MPGSLSGVPQSREACGGNGGVGDTLAEQPYYVNHHFVEIPTFL